MNFFKNRWKSIFVLFIVLLYVSVAWSLDYTIETNNFKDDWVIWSKNVKGENGNFITPNDIKNNLQVLDEYTVLNLPPTDCINGFMFTPWDYDLGNGIFMALNNQVASFTKNDKISLKIKIEIGKTFGSIPSGGSAASHFTIDLIIRSSENRRPIFNFVEFSINEDTNYITEDTDWITLTRTYTGDKTFRNEQIDILIAFYVTNGIVLSTNLDLYMKDLSSTISMTQGEPILRKGMCERCESSDECEDGFYCQRYSSKDDPTHSLFGKCIPFDSGDPCDVESDSNCYINSLQ